MGCDTYLFLSFDTVKDRTLPNLIFMLFLMSLSYFFSVYWSFLVYHSSIPGKSVACGVASNASNYGLCIFFSP
jgi:hypothetical protein